ncbi:hypothetical protein ACIRG5_45510 [Lentzea sp. NPDC102401]|uniref:hypothetical protein n=1 Tax=Lentzea sp. NPDC102401 TaxID=3364128 RepID=UPI00380F5322
MAVPGFTRAALLVTLAAWALTGCSRDPSGTAPDARAPVPAGTPAAVPPEIQQVCSDFAAASLAFDTTRDQGPGQARQRAAERFGTPELASRLSAEGRSTTTWNMVAARRGRVEVTTVPVRDDPPAPREGSAGAGAVATRVAVGDAGWRQELSTVVIYCALGREDSGWRVTGVRLADSESGAESP